MMPTGGGDLDGTTGLGLTSYVSEFGARPAERGRRDAFNAARRFAGADPNHLRQGRDAYDLDAFHQSGFRRVGVTDEQPSHPSVAQPRGRGQDRRHGTHGAVERELAQECAALGGLRRHDTQSYEHRRSQGEVEAGAGGRDIGRCQRREDLARRQPDACRGQRRTHPIGGLPGRRADRSDHRESRQAGAHRNLDGDLKR